MWEDSNKSKWIKIILAMVSLLLVAGLVIAVLSFKKREESQDAELMQVYAQQQEEQQQARQASLNEVVDAYEKDMNTVAEYMPGIVCWGDELTGGTTGGVSYPAELQQLINTKLCDLYDFRSTVKNADDFNSRIEWEDYVLEIPVVNMGTGEENVDTVLGRSGAVPFVVSKAFEIPGECEEVPILFKSENGASVAPLKKADGGINDVIIAGVEGKLSIAAGSAYNAPRYVFTRNEAGSPVTVDEGEKIFTAASEMYLDYIPVVFVGSFGGYASPSELVQKVQAFLDRQTQQNRYIVIGTYYVTYNGYGYRPGAAEMTALESAMSQAFGEHYINLRKYLANDAMADADLNPTKADTSKMSSGIVPPSLLSSENGVELTPVAYKLLGNVVYERMVQLGYFDEIVDELEIKDFGRVEDAKK